MTWGKSRLSKKPPKVGIKACKKNVMRKETELLTSGRRNCCWFSESNHNHIKQINGMFKDTDSSWSDKASSSELSYFHHCVLTYIDNYDGAHITQIAICFYKEENKNQPKQDQTDHQPTVWDNFLLPCPQNLPEHGREVKWAFLHLHNMDASTHPLNYEWMHERSDSYATL